MPAYPCGSAPIIWAYSVAKSGAATSVAGGSVATASVATISVGTVVGCSITTSVGAGDPQADRIMLNNTSRINGRYTLLVIVFSLIDLQWEKSQYLTSGTSVWRIGRDI